jgi:hypothetical protein
MIFLYTSLLLLLGTVKLLIGRRVAALERKYVRVTKAADDFLRQPLLKEGNSNRSDPYQVAKRQYLLGLLVQKRDRLEAKHDGWQTLAERFEKVVAAVRDWKGKKLPYTFGVLDVSLLLYAIDWLGVGEYLSARSVVQYVTALISH